jgi:hypothetical protein
MFGYDDVRSESVAISDPGADGTYVIWRAPVRATKIEILRASAVSDTSIAGVGTAITLTLLDRGTAGTATATAVASALGATGTGDWTAGTPRAFTISEGTLDGGDYLCVGYLESGTIAPKNITVMFEWVNGVGA